ncbi:LytTR family DNA-binding domain-containing protein [Lysobacter sp. LF1]|uniref:LytTR family DNA-binding domain-containing protein n=1 Tax=Lysobacter stagni TaxID=3045172 RepID=A0ABT6XIV4_9GAMM|nr:LytTR family DNA-binding domain-containing protein [Lysobacter sp. LF1]MDI9240062.1 LytTR family DNA-binding domain-containing protein [Lysobacter sp. LF1]
MPAASTPFRSNAWRRVFEVGFWVVTALINAAANSITVLIDVRNNGLGFASWEPVTWEWSSAVLMLALVPAVVWFTRRAPLHWDTWRRTLPWHVLASVVFCLVHVVGMVAIREAVYAAHGMDYDFGNWPRQLAYEYLKDVRSYAGMVVLIEGYRFIRRRLQGEASLLGEPDEGPPVEPVERPERFLVRKLGREFLVAAGDVEWLQASGNYVNLRVRGHDYPLRITMAAIEERLDPGRFARIHRSYMVNLEQVASIEPMDTGDARVHLADGTVLPCSRRHREALRERAGFA